MKVYGLTPADVEQAVFRVSRARYAGNLTVKDIRNAGNTRGERTAFTITVADTRGPGARTSTMPGKGHGGRRRIAAACWHAHFDVLAYLFAHGAERITSAFADYRPATFEQDAWHTSSRNVGSLFDPVCISDLCPCGDEGYWDPIVRVPAQRPVDFGHGPVDPVTIAERLRQQWQADIYTSAMARYDRARDRRELASAERARPSTTSSADAMSVTAGAAYFLDELDRVLSED